MLADGLSIESQWQQVSSNLLSILADLNNAAVWMVSARPLISNSSSSFTKTSGIVSSAPITIDITVIFMFYNLFSSLERFKYFSLFSFSIFSLWGPPRRQSPLICRFSFFFCKLWWGLVFWSGFSDLFVSQEAREVCASHSPGQILGCAHNIW